MARTYRQRFVGHQWGLYDGAALVATFDNINAAYAAKRNYIEVQRNGDPLRVFVAKRR